ncbi:MAG: VOC family protein [Rhabdochlamydiaceae bacterium]|nr:VOC family protein [Candidatus Amphrikana amoebophyrae]
MNRANLQLIYVSDVKRSTDFYKMIFQEDPQFTSPRYVTFSAGSEATFAIWSGGGVPDISARRFSEIGIMLDTDDEVESLYNEWIQNRNIKFAKELYSEVFGQTFLVEDPDGHIIRVCSKD